MKLSVFIGVSLDGFIARRNGDYDFLPADGGEPLVDCLGEDSLAAKTVEKLVADLALQVNNLLTERRLRDMTALGGAGEITRFGDGDGIAELV